MTGVCAHTSKVQRRMVLAGGLALALLGRHASAQPGVAAPILALNDALLANMKAGKAVPFIDRYRALSPVVDQAFDLEAILHASVGPRLDSIPPAERTRLFATFRSFIIASYVANFDNYGGERLEVLPDLRAVGSDEVVQTVIVPPGGDKIQLDYVMRHTGDKWQVVDVLLNGTISQNAVKRSDFRNLVTPSSVQPLIDMLQRKVSDLSGGAVS